MFKISLRISKAKKKHFENEQKKKEEIKKKEACSMLNPQQINHKRV
jgi:hypothetical protein